MSTPAATPSGLPLDNRSNDLKIPIIVLIVFSSIFVLLRLSVSLRNRTVLLTDQFLWTGYVLAVVGAAFCYKMAEVGGGHHVWDPIMTPDNLEKYLKYLWFGQLFNLYGMALIKLSICAYILMLDFSRAYRIVIGLSVVIHLGMNFVFPSVILLGECKPISKHWDVANAKPGSCWPAQPRVISGYSGAATNILTDIIYTTAPLVYISQVQLRKRTLWGVRAVFLLGLMSVLAMILRISFLTRYSSTTTISALKLYEMKALNTSPDPTYTSVNLSIFAIAEVFVGAFTASLPPLRKTFETLLRRVLPESTFGSQRPAGNSYAMKPVDSQQSSKATRSKYELDNESEDAILSDEQAVDKEGSSDQAIMRTTRVSVVVDDKAPSIHRSDEWV